MAFEKLVNKWIIDSFQSYNFEKIDVKLSEGSDASDGYIGGICFAKVYGETKNGQKEEFNVALKYGKDSLELRERFPVTASFQNEIFIYSTFVPLCRELENAKKFSEIDSFMGKCFNTLLYDNQEVLLLEDLRSLGYELYDCQKPLNIDHLKFTLEKYGKFHAFGLAYREKYPEEFNKLRLTLKWRLEETFPFFTELFVTSQDSVYSVLEAKGEIKLLDRLRKEMPAGFASKYLELCQVDEPNSVVIHGDSWNNNFMFKYDKRDQSKPKSVKFLDFQLLRTASPVYDLAYHIYATASDTELKEFPALLQVYHNSLSTCLNQLGFSSDTLFPFSELERQWKKYSLYGVLMGTMSLPFAMADKTDAVDFASEDDSLLKKMFEQVKRKRLDLYAPRVLSTFRHYYGIAL